MEMNEVIDVHEFWKEVDQREDPFSCWPWRGARSKNGVGQTKWTHPQTRQVKVEPAHRVSYYLARGSLPTYVMRICGNALCVNPAHLWGNDGSATSRRRSSTRTQAHTERPPVGTTSLSSHEVLAIRYAVARGEDEEVLAEQYGVNQRDIARIALGRTFKNVGGPLRASYYLGIKHYHDRWRRQLTVARSSVE